MEIREFAEQLLFGETLADKLIHADHFTDLSRGAALAQPPAEPGRPASLRFETDRARKHSVNLRDLERAENRGALLHHFANHEILAVELMALALLQFPDAPFEFRMSLVRSIGEEQRHFRLYRARLRKIGFDFGDFGVNDFFWKFLAAPTPMRRPLDFAVRMSMTFEQANLDYMRHYTEVFERLGDRPTCVILNTVLKDEIGHVKNGVRWFERFRADDPELAELNQWDAYQALLPEDLSPVRARGFGFHGAARQAAGLSDEYIEALRLFSYSRGRPPALYWFNPACEEAAAGYLSGHPVSNATATGPIHNIELDLEPVMFFLAGHEDALVLREAPGEDFLKTIQAAGFPIPEIYTLDAQTGRPPTNLAQRKLTDLRPWGRGPDSLTQLSELFANVVGQRGEYLRATGVQEYQRMAHLYSRVHGLRIAGDFARRPDVSDTEIGANGAGLVESVLCESPVEVYDTIQRLRATGESAVVLKACFGTAGRNRLVYEFPTNARASSARAADTDTQLRAAIDAWLARHLERYGGVIVEPWLQRVADFSAQFTVEDDGRVVVHGLTRLLNDSRGRYVGTLASRIFDELSEAARRRLADPRRGVIPILQQAARAAGAALASEGFTGPAGIDAFAFVRRGEIYLRPIVEINPRYTMGRVALEIARRVPAHRAALWLSLNRRDLKPAADGPVDFVAWARELAAAHPLRLKHDMIDEGALCTSDPARARDRMTVLIVARDFPTALAILRARGVVNIRSDFN